MKVYCYNCKYHYYPNIDGYSVHDFCLLTKYYLASPTHQEKHYRQCEERNPNNKCKEYKCKWWLFWTKT